MKLNNIFSVAVGLGLALGLSGCEGEKDLIIIEGNLPIKTSALYMVGDATPNGWSIDNPTPLTAEGEDPLIFSWEGELNSGELKLCLTTGSWDAPFIRPKENGREIGRTAITGETFQMHAGDPDEKWRVSEAGTYALTFDLRNWTVSTVYLKEPEAPVIEPIVTDALYIVGDATPNGWIIDSPTALEKKSDYVFTYEGALTAGELKACTSTGSWDVPFVRPVSDGSKISRNGAEAPDFVYTTGPDNKWRVEDAGIYRLTFDLQNWTIDAKFIGETVIEKNPIETDALYMIGDATPGGWSLDDAQVFTADPANRYIFSWEGTLVEGTLKACIEKDFGAPFIRPSAADCEISANGAAAPDFVFTKSPDDQWRVTKAGRYRLTFDLQNWTIDAKYLD